MGMTDLGGPDQRAQLGGCAPKSTATAETLVDPVVEGISTTARRRWPSWQMHAGAQSGKPLFFSDHSTGATEGVDCAFSWQPPIDSIAAC